MSRTRIHCINTCRPLVAAFPTARDHADAAGCMRRAQCLMSSLLIRIITSLGDGITMPVWFFPYASVPRRPPETTGDSEDAVAELRRARRAQERYKKEVGE